MNKILNSKKGLIIAIVVIVVLVSGVFLLKNRFLKKGIGEVSVTTSSVSANTLNIYNPNNGTLLKPGEIVQIKGTNNYITQGQIGVWSK